MTETTTNRGLIKTDMVDGAIELVKEEYVSGKIGERELEERLAGIFLDGRDPADRSDTERLYDEISDRADGTDIHPKTHVLQLTPAAADTLTSGERTVGFGELVVAGYDVEIVYGIDEWAFSSDD